jgi:hypothetical protein
VSGAGDLAPPLERAPPVALRCGHRVLVPWGSDPAVAAALLLRHELACDRSSASLTSGRTRPPGWSVRRLEGL